MDIDRARELGARESGLAVVVATRADGSPYVSVVNAGVLAHPLTGEQIVAFVARGGSRKLPNIRRNPRLTIAFRSGWDWVAVEGDADLAGPEDPVGDLSPDGLAELIRMVYAAAVGGDPDDWRGLDDQFNDERHTAVLVRPVRCYSGAP